jgi:hypothetical protein
MEANEWKISLEKYGVTGDVCESILGKARETCDANPNSIFSYSVWKACTELSSYFADPQGIPVEYARDISRIVEGPLKRLIDDGALSRESETAYAPLAELLGGLHTLRSLPRNSHGWPYTAPDSTYKETFPNS